MTRGQVNTDPIITAFGDRHQLICKYSVVLTNYKVLLHMVCKRNQVALALFYVLLAVEFFQTIV